jgi:hypothetical protein
MPITFFDIFVDKEEKLITDWETIQHNADEWYQQIPTRHGFFTPYKDSSDFFNSLSAPIGYPVGFGIGAVGALTVSGITAIGSGVMLFLSAAMYVTNNPETALFAFATAALSLAAAGAALFISAALTLAAVASIPFALLELTTRSAATIVSPVVDFFNDSDASISSVAP